MRVHVSRHCVVFWRVRRAHFDYPLYLPRYGCILYISHTKLCTFAIFKVRRIAAVRLTVRHVVFDFRPCIGIKDLAVQRGRKVLNTAVDFPILDLLS